MPAKNFHRPDDGPDAALVRALHASPRASISTLAAALNEPRASVSTRLRRLLDSGAVRVVGAVHPGFLGIQVLAHVSISTNGSIQPVVEFAAAQESIVFVSAIAGEHDIVMEVRVHTHDELHTLLAKFRAYPSVARLSTVIYSRVVHGTIEHDDFESITIDAIDSKLISALQSDGRASLSALSETVELSPSAVRARMDRMLDSRVLQLGVVEARGWQGLKLTMGVGLGLGRADDDLMQLLHDAEFVEFAAESVGIYDAIATISGSTPRALFDALEILRAHPAVLRTTTWTHLQSVKEDYTRRV